MVPPMRTASVGIGRMAIAAFAAARIPHVHSAVVEGYVEWCARHLRLVSEVILRSLVEVMTTWKSSLLAETIGGCRVLSRLS